jgi:hypothetical protein
VADWIGGYERFWQARHDRLDEVLKTLKQEENQ